jgi:hypothetical protein
MRDLALTVNGIRFKAKNLDDDFAHYVEEQLESSGVHFNRDNPAEKLFLAYLRLAAQSYNYEKEIEEIIEE